MKMILETNIEKIVAGLKALAGEDGMTSVQINSCGVCILRRNVDVGEHLSPKDFSELIENTLENNISK